MDIIEGFELQALWHCSTPCASSLTLAPLQSSSLGAALAPHKERLQKLPLPVLQGPPFQSCLTVLGDKQIYHTKQNRCISKMMICRTGSLMSPSRGREHAVLLILVLHIYQFRFIQQQLASSEALQSTTYHFCRAPHAAVHGPDCTKKKYLYDESSGKRD